MQRLLSILAIVTVTTLVGTATAELLQREDFVDFTPETFDAYPGWPMAERDHDFGAFSIAGWFDTDAFQMPIAAPVSIPAIGGDNLTLSFDPPASAVGFDLGAANFGVTTITYLGDGGTVLATFAITDFMAEGSGPSGYQGFVGFQDDDGREIHQITVGPIDLYLDNVYVAVDVVATEDTTLGSVRALFR